MAKRFQLTEEGRKSADKFQKGQPALVYDALFTSETPLTAVETADLIKHLLTTRQDPVRVVGFYFSIWKKDGFVEVVDVMNVSATVSAQAQKVADVENLADALIAEESRNMTPLNTELHPSDVKEGEFQPFANVKTIKGAVFAAIHLFDAKVPGHIAQVISESWKVVSTKQVQDALGKMLKDGELTKDEEGHYNIVY